MSAGVKDLTGEQTKARSIMPAPIRNTQAHFSRQNAETAKPKKGGNENGSADFGDAMAKMAGGLAGTVAALASAIAPGGNALGMLGGTLGGGSASGIGGVGGGLSQMQMLKMQEEMQNRAQAFQTISNCSKADHESKMNAVRNIKP